MFQTNVPKHLVPVLGTDVKNCPGNWRFLQFVLCASVWSSAKVKTENTTSLLTSWHVLLTLLISIPAERLRFFHQIFPSVVFVSKFKEQKSWMYLEELYKELKDSSTRFPFPQSMLSRTLHSETCKDGDSRDFRLIYFYFIWTKLWCPMLVKHTDQVPWV